MFAYVIETERRFYLANKVDIQHLDGGWVRVELEDAWVWDMFRPARFVSSVLVVTPRRERRGAPTRFDLDPRHAGGLMPRPRSSRRSPGPRSPC